MAGAEIILEHKGQSLTFLAIFRILALNQGRSGVI